MKKHLIAAAVAAAVAVPAAAQVTVSGTLDVRAINDMKDTRGTQQAKFEGSDGGVSSSHLLPPDGFATSQIVFTATEDLGGGMKATAYFAQRLGSVLDARDRYIDLSGGFGGIRIGRLNPTVTTNFLGLSGLASTGNAGSFYSFATSGANMAGTVAAGTALPAAAAMSATTNAAFGAGSHERGDGTIQYTTPNFNGFVASIGYRKNTNDLDTSDASMADQEQQYGTLTYTQGKLSVGIGISDRDTNGTFSSATSASSTANTSAKFGDKLQYVAGGYDFGMMRVNAIYSTRTADLAAVRVNDAKLSAISLTVPVGAITLSGSFYDGEDKALATNADDVETSGYQLSVRYALSKRTYGYVITGENKTEKSGSNTQTGADRKLKQTGVGIVHNF